MDSLDDRDRKMQEAVDQAVAEAEAGMQAHLDAGGVCDFCTAPADGRGRIFKAGVITGSISALGVDLGAASAPLGFDSGWYACFDCTPFVERRDLDGLLDRVMAAETSAASTVSGDVAVIIRDQLQQLYEELFPRLQ